MANKELLDYIKNAKNNGQADEQIRADLLNAGWRDTDINEGLSFIKTPSKNFNISRLIIIISIIIGALAIFGVGIYYYQNHSAKTQPKGSPVATEENSYNLETAKLATIPEKYGTVSPQNIVFSKNIKRVAYSVEKERKQLAIVDNKESKAYDNMQILGIAPDGKDIVLRAREGEKWFMVVNNQEGGKYDFVDMQFLATNNEDNNLIIYKAKNGGKEFVVNNGLEGKKYDELTCLGMTPSSQKIFFTAKEGNQIFFVIDNQEIKYNYDGYLYNCLRFSPDDKRNFYVAEQEKNWFIVADNKEGKKYAYLSNPRFSQDGQKIVYKAAKEMGGKQFLVVNDQEGKGYDTIEDIIISPNGQRIAYSVIDRNSNPLKYFVVSDNQEGKRYDHVGNISFSPDSKKLVYIAKEGSKEFLVIGGKESENYDSVGIFTFSPDSQRIAYLAKQGEKFSIVVDDKMGPSYDFASLVSFSSDSQNFAYSAKLGNKYFIVVNNRVGKEYDFIWPGIFSSEMQDYGGFSINLKLYFTSNSKEIVYGAKFGNELWRIVESVK